MQRPRSEESNGIGGVALGSGRPDPAAAEYSARLELTYQRAIRACAQREGAAAIANAASARIEELERRRDAADGAMGRLAARLGLTPMSVDFLWAAVACAFDGRIVPHLEALGGLHGRGGPRQVAHSGQERVQPWRMPARELSVVVDDRAIVGTPPSSDPRDGIHDPILDYPHSAT